MDLSLSEGVEGRMALREARGSILGWGVGRVLVASWEIPINSPGLSTGHCFVIKETEKQIS